jgi:cob(I)alamin adenosyltransferase
VKNYKLPLRIERFRGQVHPIFLEGKKVDTKKINKSIKDCLFKINNFIKEKKFDFIILDECLDAVAQGFLPKKILCRIIKNAKGIELVLTGRSASGDLMRLADYISFIGKIKHPFDNKVAARKSIEY